MLVVIAKLVLFIVTTSYAVDITEEPQSVTALVGTVAQFHCAGTGIFLNWRVDGLLLNTQHHVQGIKKDTKLTGSGVQSILTVPATLENNGTSVQCFIQALSSVSVFTNNATLRVLPGIGQVLNLGFSSTFDTIMWDPPPTAGVLSSLSYQLTVINMITSQVIVSTTTTDTSYTLPQITPCQEYMVNVTASSSEHQGDSVVTVQRSPGEYYEIMNVSADITLNTFNDSSSVVVVFRVQLQLRGLTIPCLNQSLQAQTYPQADKSDVTNHIELAIEGDGTLIYTITDIERKTFCVGNVMILNNEKHSVGSMSLNFSTYDIQHCDVHSDNTSILVECTFAINSTAPGFVLLQDEQGQYNINRALQRRDLSGFVNISGLPAGEYSVIVFDQEEDYVDNNPAFELDEHLKIHVPVDHQSSSTMPVTTDTVSVQVALPAGACGVLVAAIIITVIVVVLGCIYCKRRQKNKSISPPTGGNEVPMDVKDGRHTKNSPTHYDASITLPATLNSSRMNVRKRQH